MSVVKRQKISDASVGSNGSSALSLHNSSAQLATSYEYEGHSEPILACGFAPDGTQFASGSADKTIFLWNLPSETESVANSGVLTGHKSAITDLCWTRDSENLLSASADATIGFWDVLTGTRIRQLRHHNQIVNTVSATRRTQDLVVSGGDDGSAAVWDPRSKTPVHIVSTEYPILSVSVDTHGTRIFTAGIDPEISAWDLRELTNPTFTLPGHSEAVTSLSLSPDDSSIVSNGMDSRVISHDVRPFVSAESGRLKQVFDGATAGIEQNLIRAKFSPDGLRIVSGSADSTVTVWDAVSGRLAGKLKCHSGSVNDVDWHPSRNLVVSASTDRKLVLQDVSGVI